MSHFDHTDDDDVTGAYGDDNGEGAGDATVTDLDIIEAELAGDIAAEPLPLEVFGRPGYVCFYRRDVSGPELERWRKQAKRGKKEPDNVHLAGLIVVGCLERIERRGEPVTDPEGDLLKFSSPYMQRIQKNAPSAVEAARRFLGTDGYLSAQAEAILDAAGWGSDALEADPS